MNRIFSIIFLLLVSFAGMGQEVKKIDLFQTFKQNGLRTFNRELQPVEEENMRGVALNENNKEGLAWLNNLTFSTGTIEIDLKGKDVFQKSFIGIAFHGLNDSTYDAIYFRPFNFRATDSVRRIHAVQYISHPQFTWNRLREERNAQFEKAVAPVPDPNDWFHARIVVKEKEVLVFVNDAPEPSLRVDKLNNNKNGKIGLWAGDGAGGAFSNLIIKTAIN